MFKRLYLGLFLLALSSPSWALRIVSLLPSNTEVLEALGSGDDVVGVSRFDGLLKRNPKVEMVGDLIQPNIEMIVSLKPDLIVAGQWSSSHIVPRLRKMGYPVLEVPPCRSLQQIYDSFDLLAKALGKPEAAEPIKAEMQQRLEKVRARAAHLPHRFRLYIEIDRPYWTVGGNDYLNEALALTGADNVFIDLKNPAAQVSPEMIVEKNPDLIISFTAKKAEITQRSGWASVTAVRKGFIIDDLSEDHMARPSPQLVLGLEALIDRLEKLEQR